MRYFLIDALLNETVRHERRKTYLDVFINYLKVICELANEDIIHEDQLFPTKDNVTDDDLTILRFVGIFGLLIIMKCCTTIKLCLLPFMNNNLILQYYGLCNLLTVYHLANLF